MTTAVTAMQHIYNVLPQRPSVVRELVEELLDLDKRQAREVLRTEITQGRMGLGWDGKIHKGGQ